MASLTVTIEATAREPLAAGTSIVLEQPRGTAQLIINDLSSAITINVHDSVVVDDGTNNIWSGLVLRVRKSRNGMKSGQRKLKLECVSKSWLCAHPPALISASYLNASDQTIVLDLLAKAGLDSTFTATVSTVDSTKTGLTVAFGPRATLEDALNLLSDLTGARWFIDADDTLHWNADASAAAAPWNVNTDSPNGSTTYDVYDLEAVDAFDQPANSVQVVGGADADGATLTASASDATSISAYGTFHLTLEDSNWITQSQVDELAAAAVASYKDPSFQFGFSTRVDGLAPNQLISLTCSDYGLSAKQAVIRRVEMVQLNSTVTKYTVKGGDRPSSVETLLRRLRAQTQAAEGLTQVHGLDFISGGDLGDAGNLTDFQTVSFFWFSVWIYAHSVPTGSDAILLAKGNGTSSGFEIKWTTADKLEYRIAEAFTQPVVVCTAGQIPLNQWTNIQVISYWTSANADVFIDGVEASYDTNTKPSNPGDTDDGSSVKFGTNLDGILSQLAFWRSSSGGGAKVARLASKPDPAYPAEYTSDLKAYWKLDDADNGSSLTGSNSIVDSSGQANHATPTGSPVGRVLPWVP